MEFSSRSHMDRAEENTEEVSKSPSMDELNGLTFNVGLHEDSVEVSDENEFEDKIEDEDDKLEKDGEEGTENDGKDSFTVV